MSKTIMLALRAEDAEPILRKAARDAAKWGGYCDHVNRKTINSPTLHGERFEDAQKRWRDLFLSAKRTVEAFGIEYEPTTEPETLRPYIHFVGGTRKVKNIPGIGPVGWRTGSKPDYKHPGVQLAGEVHGEACTAAAERVVRRWLATIKEAKAA